jgi:hypothetical protein
VASPAVDEAVGRSIADLRRERARRLRLLARSLFSERAHLWRKRRDLAIRVLWLAVLATLVVVVARRLGRLFPIDSP